MGSSYLLGEGVTKDNIRAHMWFNLASVSGYVGAREFRDRVATKMTAKQILEAQKLARTCQESHFKNCD